MFFQLVNKFCALTDPCSQKPAPGPSIQFNLFCMHLIHRGYDPSDMEIVNAKIRLQIHIHVHTNNIHGVRYNTVNFSLYLDRQHSDCTVTVESYICCGVQYIIFKIVYEYNETTIQYTRKCKNTKYY
jgi:hypothetical protein